MVMILRNVGGRFRGRGWQDLKRLTMLLEDLGKGLEEFGQGTWRVWMRNMEGSNKKVGEPE